MAANVPTVLNVNHDSRWIVSAIFSIFTVSFVLLFSLQAYFPLWISFLSATRIVFYPCIFAALVMYSLLYKERFYFNELYLWFIPTFGWFFLSTLVSSNFTQSVSSLSLSFIVVFVCVTAGRFSKLSWLVLSCVFTLSCLIAASYVLLITTPSFAIQNYSKPTWEHPWRGVFGDKNYAGAFSALLILLSVFAPKSKTSWYRFPCILLALPLLIGSASRTALIMCTVSLLAGYSSLWLARRKGRYLSSPNGTKIFTYAFSILMLFSLVFFIFSYFSPYVFNNLLGADRLSHRTVIWRSLFDSYQEHPIMGVGFGSLWTPKTEGYSSVRNSLDQIYQAHNGYFDILLQTGVPGLYFTALCAVYAPLRALLLGSARRPQTFSFCIAIMTFCLGSNLSESGLLNRDVVWNVFLLLTVGMCFAIGEQRQTSHRKARVSRKVKAIGELGSE